MNTYEGNGMPPSPSITIQLSSDIANPILNGSVSDSLNNAIRTVHIPELLGKGCIFVGWVDVSKAKTFPWYGVAASHYD